MTPDHMRTGNLKDPADLYKEGDAAIQPSRMEGLGFMVLEPVCCGMPVITTDATHERICHATTTALQNRAIPENPSLGGQPPSNTHT